MSKTILLKWVLILCITFSAVAIVASNYIINRQTQKQIYLSTKTIPENKAGLLLGTSKLLQSGQPNLYFSYRILAAESLFKAGKIKYIVISGDNSQKDYNEPQDMKEELIKKGIPKDKIYLDYAGFRTFDSIYRMSEIFGQSNFTIISQEFHNQRAIYIANTLGLNTIGYNAKDVNAYNGFKTRIRENFARVKVNLDLLIGTKPKFLGEKVKIES